MKLSLASIFGKEHATSVQGYKDISKNKGLYIIKSGRYAAEICNLCARAQSDCTE